MELQVAQTCVSSLVCGDEQASVPHASRRELLMTIRAAIVNDVRAVAGLVGALRTELCGTPRDRRLMRATC